MKGDRLGEFEELLLLALRALGEDTYGVPVQQYVERVARRPVSMGAVYAALERLERKGFVRSAMGAATAERGGKRKRLYSVTPLGRRTLLDVRAVRERIWKAIHEGRS
jgi:DNA-binding PadR family transcriptional regulator